MHVCPTVSSNSDSSLKHHGRRVHAVPQTRWWRAIIENVSQMRVTPSARYGRPHTETRVFRLRNIFPGNRLPKTWPARAGIELGLGREERRITADASIDSSLVQIPVGTGIRHLGIGPAGDVKGISGELSPPLGVALDDFLHSDRPGKHASIRKFGNRNLGSRAAGRFG